MVKLIFLILIVAVLVGCGNDQYARERQYWRLQKQAEKIFKNPFASPPRELERVVKELAAFANKRPDSSLAIDAEFNIARLYLVKEQFDQARIELKKLLDKHSKSEAICAEAIFLIGNSYEMQDQWELALGQYRRIMQEYPVTRRGLDIPIYIAQHYKIKYQPEKMVSALGQAIPHYQALAAKFPGTLVAFNASVLTAECLTALKDWPGAIGAFNNIINTYKDKVRMDGILLNIAMIYHRELQDESKARQTLERLIKEYPDSALVKQATALVKEWSKK